MHGLLATNSLNMFRFFLRHTMIYLHKILRTKTCLPQYELDSATFIRLHLHSHQYGRGSAMLSGYLFQQWPVCMHIPNWGNVLGVSALARCVW